MRRAPLVLGGLCLVALLLPVAHAYVLPADFLLRLLAEKRRALNLKDVTAQLTAEVEGSDTPVDERLYMKSPERLRLVSQREEGAVVFIDREGQRALGPESAPKRAADSSDLTAELLMPGGKDLDEMGAHLMSALKVAGVDTSMVSLGRYEDTLAYVIGARPWEPEKPQVWLYKSSCLPLRTVLLDKSKSPPAHVETRFLDYGAGAGGDYLPAVIEVYRDGTRVRRAELTKVSVNQSLPETLFELPRK